jgi:hypothetical protein
MEVLGAIAILLLVLACPLMMVGMMVVPWLIARARGQKKEMSMSCMPMGGHEGQQASRSYESTLREEVSRLQQEVESLKAQSATVSGGGHFSAASGANGRSAADEPTHPAKHVWTRFKMS